MMLRLTATVRAALVAAVLAVAAMPIGRATANTQIATLDNSIGLEFGPDGRIVSVTAGGARLPFIPGAAGGVELTGVGGDIAVAQQVRAGQQTLYNRAGIGTAVALVSTYTPRASYIALSGRVTSGDDVPFRARFTLPLDARGWSWQQDPRSGQPIAPGATYANLSTFPRTLVTSVYPLGTVSNGTVAVTIAVPLDAPRVDRIEYTPRGLQITYDLGASPAAAKLGGAATFSLILYTSAGEWGMRGALAKYYTIYPQFFIRRTAAAREGIWYIGSDYPLTAGGRPDSSFARDYGLGINQVSFGTVRDLPRGGYVGGYLRKVPWDNATGVMVGAYVQPWGAKFLPSDMSIPYDGLIGELTAAASSMPASTDQNDVPSRIKREAIATLEAAAKDRAGRFEFEYFPSRRRPVLFQLYVNPEAGRPGANWMSAIDRDQLDLPFARAAALGGRIDAFQVDSIVGLYRWNAAFDYDRGHWATASVPLSFDPATGQVAELLAFPNYRMLAHIAAVARNRNILVSGNNGVPGNRAGGYIGSDLIDYFTLEGFIDHEIPPTQTDAYLLLKRSMASQRPISSFHREASADAYDADLRRELFYGVYTGVEASKGDVFNSPEVRTLFTRFIPLVRALSAAGWEPVPYARSSNPNLWLERYGSLAANSMYLTVRNETDEPQTGTVTLLPQPGNHVLARSAARDSVSGGAAPLSLDATARRATFPITLAPHNTAMLRIAAGPAIAR